eukprot:CAMPEP_0179084828 /NCGR_PEP_ID=MMETSP0796-20121207/38383_1 /TAXON_ID=73915 /ORGANISM="Pyrodinium bahamense, Strain pbaha01" /LENGTH=169 /DNA_ID=CAMNT_0020782255 /DNA_START=436 /DNA_END=941 /DNA_ORIENTATION=+
MFNDHMVFLPMNHVSHEALHEVPQCDYLIGRFSGAVLISIAFLSRYAWVLNSARHRWGPHVDSLGQLSDWPNRALIRTPLAGHEIGTFGLIVIYLGGATTPGLREQHTLEVGGRPSQRLLQHSQRHLGRAALLPWRASWARRGCEHSGALASWRGSATTPPSPTQLRSR